MGCSLWGRAELDMTEVTSHLVHYIVLSPRMGGGEGVECKGGEELQQNGDSIFFSFFKLPKKNFTFKIRSQNVLYPYL